MGINDPVVLHFYVRRGTWIFLQGRETFYNEEDVLMEFDTMEEAMAWAEEKAIAWEEEHKPRAPIQERGVEDVG